MLDERQSEDLRKFALQQKQRMPQENFAGQFKPFGVEGMPGKSKDQDSGSLLVRYQYGRPMRFGFAVSDDPLCGSAISDR